MTANLTNQTSQCSRTRTPWQGRQRRILLIAGVILLCPLVVFFAAKYYSDRHYAARLATIRTEGNPVTVQDMVAWQEQLHVSADVLEGDVSRQSAKTSADLQIEAAEELDTVFLDEPEDIIDIFKRLIYEEETLSPADLEPLRRYLSKHSDLLQLLHAAAELPPGRFPVDYSKGYEMEVKPLSKIRIAVRLLLLETIAETLSENRDQAFAALITAMAVPRPIREEPLVLAQWIRKSCNGMVLSTLKETLVRVSYTDAQLNHLRRMFEQEYNPNALANSLMTERVLGIAAFEDPAGAIASAVWTRRWMDDVLPGSTRTLVQTANAFGWFSGERDVYLDYMDALIPAARMPYQEARNITETINTELSDGIVLPSLSNLLLSSMDIFFQHTAEHEAGISQGILTVSLERYRLAHGTLPDQLEALVPHYLDAMPIDPFSQQPFHYRCEGNGYMLYSVGANGIDDGGVEGDFFYKEGDLVFQVRR
ncbi:MAG: hypothetical protein GXY07_09195 [Candidatus Hydrogenedentes bacterium]|nr:hypothetical protein [Candidatus Hydrogenedentota bacterium]